MANLSTYNHQDFSGGLNDTASDKEIKRTEASLLRNWDITYQGQLRKRPGLLAIADNTKWLSPHETITIVESVTVTIT